MFSLDSNIDGIYLDDNGQEQTIDNMIQVVGGADGSQSFPPVTGTNTVDLDPVELPDIEDADIVRGNRGHGILYDEEGVKYAEKGDMVFRDAENTANLKSIVNKVQSILETKNLDVIMLDYSLSSLVDTDTGISLDSIMDKAIKNVSPLGVGNIAQATRNAKFNNTSVSVFTPKLDSENTVWIVGHATVRGSGTVQLVDIASDTVLDTSYAKAENETDLIPVYLSFVGSLPEATTPSDSEACCRQQKAIYNSFYKRFFLKEDEEIAVHEVALRMVPDSTDEEGNEISVPFYHGTINMLVMGELSQGAVQTGKVVSQEQTEVVVTFETPFPDDTYSLSVQTGNAINAWYDSKSATGFVVKFEREYTGDVFWTAFGGGG